MAAKKKAPAKKKAAARRRSTPMEPVPTRGSNAYEVIPKGFKRLSIKSMDEADAAQIASENKRYGAKEARARRNYGRQYQARMRAQWASGDMAETASRAKRIERMGKKKGK
jgi:hypothetical protein